MVVAASVTLSNPAADGGRDDGLVRAGVERPGAEELRPGQDDGERLQSSLQSTER